MSVLTVSECPQQLLPVADETLVQILLLKEGEGVASQGIEMCNKLTFLLLLGLCGCLVLEGRIACLVHSLTRSKYAGQTGAVGKRVGAN